MTNFMEMLKTETIEATRISLRVICATIFGVIFQQFWFNPSYFLGRAYHENYFSEKHAKSYKNMSPEKYIGMAEKTFPLDMQISINLLIAGVLHFLIVRR